MTAFDLDALLDGARRTERTATLYLRHDLIADVEELQAQKRQIAEIPDEDRSYADADPSAYLDRRIGDLYLQIDASRLDFRVSFLTDDEVEDIKDAVAADPAVTADVQAAVDKAAKDARDQAKLLDITAVNDINTLVRTMRAKAADQVREREINIRTIAAAAKVKNTSTGSYEPVSAEQIRKIYTKVGDAQIQNLSRAYSRAMVEEPQVTVPKSSKPSPTGDGLTSS
jgi:ribosomal protein S13